MTIFALASRRRLQYNLFGGLGSHSAEVLDLFVDSTVRRSRFAHTGVALATFERRVENFASAAQTAKQVILQRLREAEREIVMNDTKTRLGPLLNAVVSRVEGNIVRIDLGKAQGIMPRSEQIQGERYYPGPAP